MAILCAMLACPGWSSAATRYDPHLRFRSIRTPHFTVLYHQGERELAMRLATLAEEVHATLSRQLLATGDRHTRVILVDQHDDANGWATPLPFDTIEITAVAPDPSAAIGYTDDWLRLVFIHEYTHILHLDRSRGLFAGLRRVFGRAPLLFPNLFLPAWETEGLATFYETADTGLGRLQSGEFRLVVDAAARAGRIDPIDRATGALVDWPGGNAAYAYGARFHEYLAARFGDDAFGRLASATAGRVPYFPGGAYQRVFGASAQRLWKDFTSEEDARLRAPDSNAPTVAHRLTHQGFIAAGPRWLPDGSLVYSSRTPHEFPALKRVSPAGGVSTVAERYLGERASVWGGRVFFDQQELVRNVGLQSDLYVVTLADPHVQRLTRGERAADPDVAPDGRAIVYVVRQAGRSFLVLRSIVVVDGEVRLGEPRVLRDDPSTQYAAPRWSHDGSRIAAERRRLHARPDVVVIDVRQRAIVRRISAADGRVGDPEWLPGSAALLVTWERPEAPFNLYEVDLSGGGAARAVLTLPNGARYPAITDAGDRLAFVGYSPDGYDVFSTELPFGRGPAAPEISVGEDTPVAESPAARTVSAAAPGSDQPYSPAGTLLPRFWMPVIQTDEDRVEAGAGTAGVDALGRQAWAATVRWADRSRPDWDVSYAYDRWRPTLYVSASDDLTVWQGSDYRETSVDAGVLVPFARIRRRQWLYGALHATREEDPSGAFDRRALRLAYELSTSRRYGYSVSPENGVHAGGTAEVTRTAFGSDADATTLTADIRAYARMGGRHRVLALRAALATSYGDRSGLRALGAGGTAAPGSTIAFGRDAIGLARGFATDDIVGTRAAVVNVDYRLPLWNVERGIGSLPVFIRQFHAAAFVDAAHAWRRTFRTSDVRTSAGLELSSDLVLGHYLPLTVTGGLALRRDPTHVQEGAAAFWRIGYAF